MRRGIAFAFLGIVTVNTPSLPAALTLSLSTVCGRFEGRRTDPDSFRAPELGSPFSLRASLSSFARKRQYTVSSVNSTEFGSTPGTST